MHNTTSLRKVVPVLALVACTACGGGGGGSNSTAAAARSAPPPAPEAPFGIDQRTTLSGLTLPGDAPGGGSFELRNAFPNLTFAAPLYFAGVPGESRVVVVEQGGRVHAFVQDPAVTTSRVVLDLSSQVLFSGEQGLLGLAFDPQFTVNRFVYVHYSRGGPARSVIARFTWDGAADAMALASERVILEVTQPFSNHNGGSLQFGPDGFLYIALGDGGSGGDPNNEAQNLASLLGAILRIDVHPANPALAYSVPTDNPFEVDGDPTTASEIWAYGLRNPYRMSFDRQTGELWAGDVGQGALEEIDLIQRGGNYGWSRFEGTSLFNSAISLQPTGAAAIPPIHEYGRSDGVSVIGGYVYRGARVASLFGRYLFADFGSGNVWMLVYDGSSVQSNDLLAIADQPSSFGEDNFGDVHVVSRSGSILIPVEVGGGGSLPDLLSETGIFTDLANLTPAPGLIEYDLNVPFWSDGAFKTRWIGLPGVTTMEFDPTAPWTFPEGTVLVKHFEVALDEAVPEQRRRLETRLLLSSAAGWQGFTYRWNPAGTDADLLAGRGTETLTISDPQGVERSQLYTYPSRTDCLQCHTAVSGGPLGVVTRQVNRSFDYPSVTDSQLRSWNHIGLFSTDIGAANQYDAYPALTDSQTPVAERARAWLDVNCASCHQPGGPTGVDIDLRSAVTEAQMNVIAAPPVTGDLGLVNAAIVAPGGKESSVLWERIRRLDATRMPPLASHRVDAEGVDLVGRWIDSL